MTTPYRLPRLLLALLPLAVWAAEAAENGSLTATANHLVAKEGSGVQMECNLTGGRHGNVEWYTSKGPLPLEHQGGRWRIQENGVLNITAVSFEDRGRYTCVVTDGGVRRNYTVTLRVAYTHSGLGIYYVAVCLTAFFLTMILNAARLCMMSGHVKKTEGAIEAFFRTEGAEKLQRAFEVAKRIPIVTSVKTLEFAKVTQFKTMEFARHVEELARSVPLPPLILSCRALAAAEEEEEDGVGGGVGRRQEGEDDGEEPSVRSGLTEDLHQPGLMV